MDDPLASLGRGFQGLCVAHYAGILRYLAALAPDRHLAEDLAQETFIAAYRRLHRFQVGRDFAAWLRGIARHLFLKSLRGARPVEDSVIDRLDALFERESRAGIDGLEALDHCIRRLKEEERKLIADRYDRGLPVGEIARALGQGESWAKVQLHRVRRKLRACLEQRLSAGAAP